MKRTPLYVAGCFAWLHEAEESSVAQSEPCVGVVLCPAFAQEEMCTHYGLMALADELAAKGLPTLRFDYRGTGDSVAAELSLAGFIADAQRAADYLRAKCGLGSVAFAGVRMGATIAFHAARSYGATGGLVLLAPPLSGAAFLRETRAAAIMNSSLSQLDPVPAAGSGLPLNTNGFHWPASLQKEIASEDLTRLPAPSVPTLLLSARTDRRAAKLVEAWRADGACVEEQPFAEYETWVQDPTTSTVPQGTFVTVSDWLSDLRSESRSESQGYVVRPALNSATELTASTFREEPIRFGADDVLFGVLCRPRSSDVAPVAALLLHEGSSTHIGNGGAYVTLARQLAAAGIASLRMDLTGIGDCPAGDNSRHPHYDPQRIDEALLGVDVLEQSGFPKCVVFGLCAGAYTALHVSLGDERVVGSSIVNLQKFIWHYGDDIRVALHGSKRSLKAYVRAMGNRAEWRRTLSGKADVRGVARALVRRNAVRVAHAVRSLLPTSPESEIAVVHGWMRELSARHVHTTLLFSADDPGLAEFWMKFGRKGRRVRAFSPASFVLLPRADHHLNASDARRRYHELALTAMQAVIAEHAPARTYIAPAKAAVAESRTAQLV
jgi:alpha/beta superfamily hydrolase